MDLFKRSVKLVGVAMVAGLLAGCATTHPFTHTVNVRVQQLDGTPIKGAKVTVNSQTHKTNKQGAVKRFTLHDADLWVVTYADGFVTQTSRFPENSACMVNGALFFDPCSVLKPNTNFGTYIVVLMEPDAWATLDRTVKALRKEKK